MTFFSSIHAPVRTSKYFIYLNVTIYFVLKCKYLFAYGVHLANKSEKSLVYSLYHLNGYYVEIEVKRSVITRVKAIENNNVLDKYLDKVNITELVELDYISVNTRY